MRFLKRVTNSSHKVMFCVPGKISSDKLGSIIENSIKNFLSYGRFIRFLLSKANLSISASALVSRTKTMRPNEMTGVQEL